MKVVGIIAKILTVLAAVVGAIYALATYGEQIVAWAKKVMENLPKCEITVTEGEEAEEADEEVVEEAVEEVAEEVAEVVEEVVEAAEEVIADDADFEG